VDYGYTSEQLTEALSQTGFRSYRILGRREVTKEELTPQGWNPQPPPPSERRRPPNGWIKSPFCSWIVLQRAEPDPATPHMDRFSLLYLCADGVAAYQALYTSNQKFPACIAVIQPGTGFGGNWTDFTDPEKAFYQAIRANPAGRPGYLLHGGNGPSHFYEKPCWPAYSIQLKSHHRAGFGRVGLWATDCANSQKSGNLSSDGSSPLPKTSFSKITTNHPSPHVKTYLPRQS